MSNVPFKSSVSGLLSFLSVFDSKWVGSMALQQSESESGEADLDANDYRVWNGLRSLSEFNSLD